MKKIMIFTALAVALVSTVAPAVDSYTVRDVRDPRVLASRLTADFTSVVSTSDAARVTALEETAITNATAATAITPNPGVTVTATAASTPQTATITVALTPQTVDVTNAEGTVSAVWTNATASFTGMTNATIAVTVANGAGLLTNATAVTTMTLQRN